MKNMRKEELHRVAEAMSLEGPTIPRRHEAEDEQFVLLDRQEPGTGDVVTLAYRGQAQEYESFQERFWMEVVLECQRQGILPPGAKSSSDDGDLPELPQFEELPF